MPVMQGYLIYVQGYKVMNLPDIFHALTLAPWEQCEYMHKFGGAWVDAVCVCGLQGTVVFYEQLRVNTYFVSVAELNLYEISLII